MKTLLSDGNDDDDNNGPRDGWGAISDLDAFFAKIYEYYVEKGFWCLILSRTTNLLTLAFTVIFSTFLMVFVNWSALLSCDGEISCKAVVGIRPDAYSSPTFGEVIVAMYFTIFCIYWLWNLVSFITSVREIREIASFYNTQLGFQDEELATMEWFTVVERLVKLQETVNLCIVKDLTALDITNRIMRRENYLIALINMNRLNFSIPWLDECRPSQPTPPTASSSTTNATTSTNNGNNGNNQRDSLEPIDNGCMPCSSGNGGDDNGNGSNGWNEAIFGKTLEWNLRFCILSSMFDNHFHIRKDFVGQEGVRALKRRFLVMGILNLVLMPFIMIFMLIFFFLKNAEELHSKKSVLGPRQWTPLSHWKLREFNEMPHFFQRRLAASYEPAQMYISQFPSTMAAVIAQAMAYIAGSVVGLLLLLSLSDSSLLLSMRVMDRTLLWHLAFFSIIVGVSRSFIPEKGMIFRPQAIMAEVVKYTHYLPDHWRGRTHKYEVKEEFGRMYRQRVLIFIGEVASVLLTPAILCFSLPQSAEAIISFVEKYTTKVSGVGELCSFAMFDLDRLGDDLYSMDNDRINHVPARHPGLGHDPSDKKAMKIGPHMIIAATNDTHDTHSSGNGNGNGTSDRGTYQPPVVTSSGDTKLSSIKEEHARNGKLEKSFVSFAMNHPHWRASRDGARYLSHLATEVQQHQLAALGRRQRIYQGVSGHGHSSTTSAPHTPPNNGGITPSSAAGVTSSQTLRAPAPVILDRANSDENDEVSSHVGPNDGSVDLSQSDRHLISSFTDLLALAGSTGVVPSSTSDLTSSIVRTPYHQPQQPQQQLQHMSRYAPHTPSSRPGRVMPSAVAHAAAMRRAPLSSSMALSQSLTGAPTGPGLGGDEHNTQPLPVDLALSTGAGYLIQADVTQPQSMWSQDAGGVGVHGHVHGASAIGGGLLADPALAPPNVFALMERSVDYALVAKQNAAIAASQTIIPAPAPTPPISTAASSVPEITITMGAQRAALPGAFQATLLDNDHLPLSPAIYAYGSHGNGNGNGNGNTSMAMASYQQPLLLSSRPVHVGASPSPSLIRQRQGSGSHSNSNPNGNGNGNGASGTSSMAMTPMIGTGLVPQRRDSYGSNSNSNSNSSSLSTSAPRRQPIVMNLLPIDTPAPATATAAAAAIASATSIPVTNTTSTTPSTLHIDAPLTATSSSSTTRPHTSASNTDMHSFFGPSV